MNATPNYVRLVLDDLEALLPGCDDLLLRRYALLALTTGGATTLEDIHHAWSEWCDVLRPEHRSLVSFNQLTAEVQELDRKYMLAVHQAAERHHRRSLGLPVKAV